MTTLQQLLVINSQPAKTTFVTPAQLINYFLIALSITTGLLCLGQFLIKLHRRLKRSPLISYGLQAGVKNKKAKSECCANASTSTNYTFMEIPT